MITSRNYRFAAFTLLIALVLGACAAPTPVPTQPAPGTDDSWTKVQQAGKLIVGTSADYAPFESYNSRFQIDGFDIALIDAQPTPAPPQATPQPPACVDSSAWVADLSYDDNNMTNPPVMQPGQPIPVTKQVNPGETFDFQVNLVAPIAPGTYQGFWNMRNTLNQKFGETVWVGFTVPGVPAPTPAPTQTPSPDIVFNANPTTITAGHPVKFDWATSNVKAVYFYHDGQDWQNHGVPGVGQSTEYPPYTINYYLRVVNTDNSVTVKTRTITVNQPVGAPVINQFNIDPPAITLGQCVNIVWQVSGQVSNVTLVINTTGVWPHAPLSGSYQDCPVTTGQSIYQLTAQGPGGSTQQQVTVNVSAPAQPTATPAPQPTATPAVQAPVINGFTISPDTVSPGGCTMLAWTTGGGTTSVNLLRDNVIIWNNAPTNSSVQDCPPIPDNATLPLSIVYTLQAYNSAGQMVNQTVSLIVQPLSVNPQ